METQPPIRTVAAVIADADGRVLLVRKRGSQTFIQPGGKREAGEDALTTLARELAEELGVQLQDNSVPLGEFEDVAVNEPGRRVRAEAFWVTIAGTPVPRAEIEELIWISPIAPHAVPVAPLSAAHILPRFLALASPA
jgi:8-oxo-dGTP pyrophosphatase MutT (NUDIX family)